MRNWQRISLSTVAATAIGSAYFAAPTHADPTAVVIAQPPVETDFRSGVITIDTTKGTEAVVPTSVNFEGRQVLSAQVLLKGFDVQFDDSDHALHRELVRFENIDIQGSTVKFDTRLLLRDNSGNIDDKYSGRVDYVVIARVK